MSTRGGTRVQLLPIVADIDGEIITPTYHGDDPTPWCHAMACVQHDGKRCQLLGHPPESVCLPAIRVLVHRLENPKLQPLSEAALSDALDGFFAYDVGCTDSGIRDEDLRERVKTELLANPSRFEILARITRDLYGHPPYTLEDVSKFTDWLREQGLL